MELSLDVYLSFFLFPWEAFGHGFQREINISKLDGSVDVPRHNAEQKGKLKCYCRDLFNGH